MLPNLSFDQQRDELTDGSTVVLTVKPGHCSVHELGRKIRELVAYPLRDHRKGWEAKLEEMSKARRAALAAYRAQRGA